ncbi:MAG: uridine kinase family protein, partial [Limisphaerales bacterium]
MKRKLVAIVGGSGAGKSYLASRIASRLGFGESIIIRLDDFYRDLSLMPLWERDVVNFDEPDAIDWEEFLSALDRIINQDEPAQLPIYDYKTHSRLPLRRVFEPKQLTIIEGLW